MRTWLVDTCDGIRTRAMEYLREPWLSSSFCLSESHLCCVGLDTFYSPCTLSRTRIPAGDRSMHGPMRAPLPHAIYMSATPHVHLQMPMLCSAQSALKNAFGF